MSTVPAVPESSSTRRSFLAGLPRAAAMLASVPALAAALPKHHPDAALLVLVDRPRKGVAEAASLAAEPDVTYSERHYFDAYDRNVVLLKEIAASPAVTLDGLKAKAIAAVVGLDFDPDKRGQFGGIGLGLPEGILRDLVHLAAAKS